MVTITRFSWMLFKCVSAALIYPPLLWSLTRISNCLLTMPACISLKLASEFFLGGFGGGVGTRSKTQDLTLARQALCLWAKSPAPHNWINHSIFPPTNVLFLPDGHYHCKSFSVPPFFSSQKGPFYFILFVYLQKINISLILPQALAPLISILSCLSHRFYKWIPHIQFCSCPVQFCSCLVCYLSCSKW